MRKPSIDYPQLLLLKLHEAKIKNKNKITWSITKDFKKLFSKFIRNKAIHTWWVRIAELNNPWYLSYRFKMPGFFKWKTV